jgi:hypothetical protein
LQHQRRHGTESDAQRIEMGKAARRRIETHFSVERQVDQLVALWSKVLAGSPSTSMMTTG